MEAGLIKNDTAQQKSAVTLTLIHAAFTPPCIDLLLKMHKHRDASPPPLFFFNISKRVKGQMIAAAHLADTPLKAPAGN